MPLRGTILGTLKRQNGDRAFYNPSPQQIEKLRPEFKISEWVDCVGVDDLESVTASRENYDVEVRCMSGVRDRYYDPETGRYVTSDPIGLGGGINTFGYAYQNPLVYFDPTGERNFLRHIVQVLGIVIGFMGPPTDPSGPKDIAPIEKPTKAIGKENPCDPNKTPQNTTEQTQKGQSPKDDPTPNRSFPRLFPPLPLVVPEILFCLSVNGQVPSFCRPNGHFQMTSFPTRPGNTEVGSCSIA